MRRVDFSRAARRDMLGILVFPFSGRVVKPARRKGTSLRSYRVSNRFWQYLVFYRVFASSIRVVRVMHGAQDTRSILRLTQ
jgi:plasmid stabilization system protein ParE